MSTAASSVLRKRLATAGAAAVTTVAASQALESKTHVLAEQPDRVIFNGGSNNTNSTFHGGSNNTNSTFHGGNSMVSKHEVDNTNTTTTQYALDVLESCLKDVDVNDVMALGADLASDPGVQAAVLARVRLKMKAMDVHAIGTDCPEKLANPCLANPCLANPCDDLSALDPAQVQGQFELLSACLDRQKQANRALSARMEEMEALTSTNQDMRSRLEELEDADELNNQLVLFAQMKSEEKLALKEQVKELKRANATLEGRLRDNRGQDRGQAKPVAEEEAKAEVAEEEAHAEPEPMSDDGMGYGRLMKAALGVAGVIIVCVLMRRLPNNSKMTSLLGAAMAGMFASKTKQ